MQYEMSDYDKNRAMMVAQNIILPTSKCNTTGLYFQTAGTIDFAQAYIHMQPGTEINTSTYMNLFDTTVWDKYTGIKKWKLKIDVSGKGTIHLISNNAMQNEAVTLQTIRFDSKEMQELHLPFEKVKSGEQIYFEIEAEQETWVYEAKYYINDTKAHQRDVHIGVIICTYKRNKELYQNIEQFQNSAFFDENHFLYGKLSIRIVDNASELPMTGKENIKLYHNPNTGGSGGFTRGIVETRKEEKEYGITHVVLMDDDVEFVMESFYRLYALLAFLKADYQEEVIAGRMFRMDRKWIQYTAAEIWNAGKIEHIGWNLDMIEKKNLQNINENTGAEYSGWWFSCFPMKFVRENTPLPFFLHCDDVEYGLRHGGTPLILNGIQVWHETYEYRQNPVMAYYDTRNPLIVNELYGLGPNKVEVLAEWKRKITEQHIKGDYLTERMIILGMRDYCRGMKWFMKKNPEWKQNRLVKKKMALHFGNAALWRITETVYKQKFMQNMQRLDRNII